MRAPGPRRPCRACVLLNHRKETAAEPPARRAKISTRAADPAMGWTSPLPAVRMRAAMLVSAVVATCRGRRRRGAIREDVCWLLTSRTDGVGFRTLSTRLSQIGTSSNAAARKYYCDAFWLWLPARRASDLLPCAAAIGPRPRRLAHGVLSGPVNFEPRRSGAEHAAVKLKAAPRARRRAAAMMHR